MGGRGWYEWGRVVFFFDLFYFIILTFPMGYISSATNYVPTAITEPGQTGWMVIQLFSSHVTGWLDYLLGGGGGGFGLLERMDLIKEKNLIMLASQVLVIGVGVVFLGGGRRGVLVAVSGYMPSLVQCAATEGALKFRSS